MLTRKRLAVLLTSVVVITTLMTATTTAGVAFVCEIPDGYKYFPRAWTIPLGKGPVIFITHFKNDSGRVVFAVELHKKGDSQCLGVVFDDGTLWNGEETAPSATLTDTYTVKLGDTGYSIAEHLGIGFAALEETNPDIVWTRLPVEEKLVVPSR